MQLCIPPLDMTGIWLSPRSTGIGEARRGPRRAGAGSSPNSEAANCALPLGSASRLA